MKNIIHKHFYICVCMPHDFIATALNHYSYDQMARETFPQKYREDLHGGVSYGTFPYDKMPIAQRSVSIYISH